MDRAIALLFALLASRPSPGGSVTVALWDQPVAAGDPARALRWSDQVIALATAEGLYRDGKPALAAEDPVMLAPQIARVRLRAELHAQDGRPVAAADVAAALDRVLRSPQAALVAPVHEARAIGPDTVELALAKPASAAEVAAALSAPQTAVPRTGPFVLAQIGPGEVRLEAWTGYHGGRPWLDRVVLHAFPTRREEQEAFELGKLQVMLHGSVSPSDLRSAPTLYTFLGGFSRLPPKVAQALPLAIDRDAVRRFAARGPAQSGPGPSPNAAQARALCAEAKDRTFSLLVDRSRTEDFFAAQKVQTQLAGVGLQVRIDAVPPAEYERRIAAGSDFDLYVAAAPLLAWPEHVLPLYARSVTVRATDGLRGLRLDALGRLRFDDAFFWRPHP